MHSSKFVHADLHLQFNICVNAKVFVDGCLWIVVGGSSYRSNGCYSALISLALYTNRILHARRRGIRPSTAHEFAKVITTNNIRIVETCGGGIPLMRKVHELLRAGGVEVLISKCVQVKHALAAQNELGADIVSLMGFDSGG